MKKVTLLVALVCGSVSLSATAQQGMGGDSGDSGRQTKTFTELDANNDGILEQDEVSSGDFDGDFNQLDADGDGDVNRNEYYQYYREQATQR